MFSDLDRPPLAYGGALRVPPGWRAEVVASTGSTNADVVARARAGEAPGLVLVAEEQTAGRGRLTRSWSSPPRAGLTFSALLDVAPSPWVPLLAGVAVARALREVAGLPAGVAVVLKWPNDVLLAGPDGTGAGKVAGLLAEVAAGPAGPRVVLGCGLNVTTRGAELPPDGRGTSLRLAGARVTDRATILRAVLRQLGEPADPVDYAGICATIDREVVVHLPGGGQARGVAERVDGQGRLVVAGTPYAAGDVVHVR